MPIITSQPGRRYRFRHLEFWAERGLVHLFDFRGNPYQPEYKEVSVREMLQRARAINRQAARIQWVDERIEHERLVADVIACCKEAQRQGRPDDPKTWEHIRAMRRDKHFLLPGPDVGKEAS